MKKKKTSLELVLAIILSICFCLAYTSSKAQVFVSGGAGMTKKFFSGEMQVGVKMKSNIALKSDEFEIKILPKNATISFGYTSIQLVTDQPALFNARAGYLIAERLHVYGGYVRVHYSNDCKSLNYDTWQAGAQFLFSHFDKGTFYIGTHYTGNKMISAHIGMTWNLSQGLD